MPKKRQKDGLLFVYGTLMKGFRESWQRDLGASLVGTGTIRARLYDVGDFPAAIQSGRVAGERVRGELYRLSNPQAALRKLDEYEEYFPTEPQRSIFVRKVVPVKLADGTRESAWVYLYNRSVEGGTRIPSGNYRDRSAVRV